MSAWDAPRWELGVAVGVLRRCAENGRWRESESGSEERSRIGEVGGRRRWRVRLKGRREFEWLS